MINSVPMPAPVKVSIPLVNGGLLEYEETPSLLEKLRTLQARGLQGKALIHELLTDDWGAPPKWVTISGTAPDGEAINVRIFYE